jgi:hypothetical protein
MFMLKKSFFLVIICLLFGAFSTQLSAQSNQGWGQGWYMTQVVCDGEYLGDVWGFCDVHYVAHFKDGEWVFTNYQAKGEGYCTWSDEKFSYKEKGKHWVKNEGVGYYVLRLKGDQGSKFNLHVSIDYNTYPWTWTFTKANCH